jgi:putative hemolysin
MIESTVPLNGQHSGSKTSPARNRTLEPPSAKSTGFAGAPGVAPSIPGSTLVDWGPHAQPANRGWKPMEWGPYRVTIARTLAEREAACRLRFKVFNIELGEGLQSSYRTGLDTDHFDLFCEQLIVEDRNSRSIVGTYRMQTGTTAAEMLGYYSEQEFDFAPYERIRPSVLELGRASIDREHRSSEVLTLLWRGITQYTRLHNLRYLIGCSSVNSQDPRVGWQIYRQLSAFLAAVEFRTSPNQGYTLAETGEPAEELAKVPKLLRTYIGIGAKICGAPALDREFGTIDFLTLLDMRELTPAARVRFLTEAQ